MQKQNRLRVHGKYKKNPLRHIQFCGCDGAKPILCRQDHVSTTVGTATKQLVSHPPRRFGKSLFLSMLRAYYDINRKDKFQSLFGSLWIGQHPTVNQGRYQILFFDFSRASAGMGSLAESFNNYCSACLHFIEILMKEKIMILLVAFLAGHISVTSAQTDNRQSMSLTSEVCIPSGRENIFGVLSKPAKTESKQPIAIIAHGFNGTHQFGKNYFERLNRMGYQCYAFDFPCGSVNSLSNNNTMGMSIIDEQQYLEAVVRHFQSQPDVDADRIVLIGESQGGLVSALVAANSTMNIHKLILVFPALCIPDNWNERYKQIADIPDTTRLWNVALSRRFFTELRYMNPLEIIGRYKRPVLIVHGDADTVVPVDYSRRAAKTYVDARLIVLDGEGHGFKPQGFQRSLDEIEKFLLGK